MLMAGMEVWLNVVMKHCALNKIIDCSLLAFQVGFKWVGYSAGMPRCSTAGDSLYSRFWQTASCKFLLKGSKHLQTHKDCRCVDVNLALLICWRQQLYLTCRYGLLMNYPE
jgi:hypothetical protein